MHWTLPACRNLIVAALAAAALGACSDAQAPQASPPSPAPQVAEPETAPASPTPLVALALDELNFPGLAQTPLVPQMAVYRDLGDLDFPNRCTHVRAAQPQELADPWPQVVTKIVLDDCSEHRTDADGDLDTEPFVFYQVSAAFKPYAVTLQGLPVAASHYELSELHASYSYVLDAPLEQALATLRPQIERNCQPMLDNPAVPTDCVMRQQEDGIWSVSVGELNSYNTLQRDPQNPGRSLYSEGGGD
jgi:hypothetical protein